MNLFLLVTFYYYYYYWHLQRDSRRKCRTTAGESFSIKVTLFLLFFFLTTTTHRPPHNHHHHHHHRPCRTIRRRSLYAKAINAAESYSYNNSVVTRARETNTADTVRRIKREPPWFLNQSGILWPGDIKTRNKPNRCKEPYRGRTRDDRSSNVRRAGHSVGGDCTLSPRSQQWYWARTYRVLFLFRRK